MRMPKNIVCLEIAFDHEIESKHLFNMDIISKNLEDFNIRFETDVMLSYDIYDYTFPPPLEDNDENTLWFCDGINELLAFAHSPTTNDRVDLDLYLELRKNDIIFLHNPQLYDPYVKRYFDYAPLGFLTDESMNYIKYEINNLLFN